TCALEHRTDLGVTASLDISESTKIGDEQLVTWVFDRSLGQESQPSGRPLKSFLQGGRGVAADRFRRQILRAARQKPVESLPGDEPSIEKKCEPEARPRHAQL